MPSREILCLEQIKVSTSYFLEDVDRLWKLKENSLPGDGTKLALPRSSVSCWIGGACPLAQNVPLPPIDVLGLPIWVPGWAHGLQVSTESLPCFAGMGRRPNAFLILPALLEMTTWGRLVPTRLSTPLLALILGACARKE